jgi:hypothetical protein
MFSNFEKAFTRTAEKRKHFGAPLEYVLRAHRNLEIYWSLDQVILDQYLSNMYVFTLTDGKMATARAHQRNILEIQKPVKSLSWT